MSSVDRVVIDGVEYVRASDFDRLNSYFREDMDIAPRTDKWTLTGDHLGDYIFKDCAITVGKDITVTNHIEVAILALMITLKRALDVIRDKEQSEHLHGSFMNGVAIRGSIDNPQCPPFPMDRLTGSILKGTK